MARTLDAAGLTTIFTLSGNHIMPLFDAASDAAQLIHVRHEAAAVHMADAWGGSPANAASRWSPAGRASPTRSARSARRRRASRRWCCCRASAAEEVGRGAFQELRQAEMAAPVDEGLVGRALRGDAGHGDRARPCASPSGRPGPVHVSLPFDLLEETSRTRRAVARAAGLRPANPPLGRAGRSVLAAIAKAQASPHPRRAEALPCAATGGARTARGELGVPVVPWRARAASTIPALGAFAEVLREAT